MLAVVKHFNRELRDNGYTVKRRGRWRVYSSDEEIASFARDGWFGPIEVHQYRPDPRFRQIAERYAKIIIGRTQ